ncbi:Dehydrogenase/reductase SDR family member on chromosome X [Halotydeus destructor]|nr:Dehydrogenase/reductase SDR family member on chromosome X [Halotydeus destructor]
MEEKTLINKTREFLYDQWCCICLYLLGSFYVLVELNRKFNVVSQVRKLDEDKDLPSSLTGKVCVITGGSRGIGWEAAKVLLIKGCHVIVASSVAPGEAQRQLKDKLMTNVGEIKGRLEVWNLNLGSFDSVQKFADQFKASKLHLNVLINNAGQMYSPFKLTEDRYESHLQVNYLSHCLLVSLLLPIMEQTGLQSGTKSRIINVSSSTHFARDMNFSDLNGEQMYSPFHAYAQSKLAQVMYTYKLHKVLPEKNYHNVSVNTLHPGVAKTELYEHVWWVVMFPFLGDMLFRTAKEGAETVLYAGFASEMEAVGGKYLEDCAITSSSISSYIESQQGRLWNQTAIAISPWLDQKERQLFDI